MELIYLAAGRGSRLKKKTSDIPKCLVKVNNKSIIDYNLSFFNNFKKVNLILGYKYKLIISKFKKNKFNYVINKNYLSTNMVESTFLAKPIHKYVVICYGDIIFDNKIFHNLKKIKCNTILIKTDWLSVWKKRMSNKEILNDAEDIKIDKKNNLLSIGGKINKIPKYQYMGIIKLKIKSFKKLNKYYKKLNKKIDFTSFINLAIKEKVIKFKVLKTKKYWVEIDTTKDILAANKILPKEII